MVEGYFGQQTLETESSFGRLATLPQVVVDDEDLVPWPTEVDSAVGESILAGGGLLVFEDLLGRRLADIDHGGTVEVPELELGGAEKITHGRPP
jgi:hypothetical protein